MYKSCLICHGDLGSNTVIEHSPIGRAFAFDTRTGRFWILCRRCQAWNLTPELERWEAIEECQRRFEQSERRYATDHIGLAEVGNVQLVAVAGPAALEFAAWRYGRRWATRRYRAAAHASLTGLAVGGLLAVGGGLAFGVGGIAIAGYVGLFVSTTLAPSRSDVLTRIPIDETESYGITRSDLRFLRVVRRAENEWVLDTQEGARFDGDSLRQALSLVLPLVNRWGGNEEHRQDAIELIRSAGGSEGFVAKLAGRHLHTLRSFTRAERLALEMAANEDVERRALEGELRLLRAAWREADLVAQIHDSLLIPLPVEERFRRIREASYGSKVGV